MTSIIAFSDSHSQHRKFSFPESDILIFAGDCNCSRLEGLLDFYDWFQKQPSKHKIFIPGNHDWFCQDHPDIARAEAEKCGIIYLLHEPCEIMGIKFFGSPYTPEFCGWAFMKSREAIGYFWDQIPEDTEILVSHGPAYGIMDKCPNGNVGCKALLNRINHLRKLDLRVHIFGHIHESAGSKRIGKMKFMNVSVLDGSYVINNVNQKHRKLDFE